MSSEPSSPTTEPSTEVSSKPTEPSAPTSEPSSPTSEPTSEVLKMIARLAKTGVVISQIHTPSVVVIMAQLDASVI